MRGDMTKGYGPDGSYPSRVVYLDRGDVLCEIDPAAGCVGDEGLPGRPCPGVFYETLDQTRPGDEVSICPVHGVDVTVRSVEDLVGRGDWVDL